MIQSNTIIKNPTGLHLRPAGLLCQTAMEFKSKITLHYEDCYANAKSVLGVLGACVKSGDEIELICEGEDEEVAMNTLLELIKNGLGEDIGSSSNEGEI